jgi:leucine dehydrogenase
VNSLGGQYVTAEDVGTRTADMEIVSRQTRFVSGRARATGEAGGDPSPKTALGVHLGIKAAAKFQLGRTDLQGLRVAVQGVGGVGYHLCRMLAAEGARLIAADVRQEAVERVRNEFNATIVGTAEVLAQEADVVAPCALGAILNAQSIPRLRARIIAGAANNQLAVDADGVRVLQAGILYAPDYVINAGGIISVSHEYYGGSTNARIDADIHGIPERLTEIFERSRRESRPTNEIADQLARERIGRA